MVPVSLAASHYPVDAPVVDDEYLRVSRATGTAAFPLTPLPMTSTRTRRDPDHISSVVRFDLPRLGSVSGLDMVHLQSPHQHEHAVARSLEGADDRTGLLAARTRRSRRHARKTGADIEYVEADVHQAREVLGSARFDMVFTGIGALFWQPGGLGAAGKFDAEDPADRVPEARSPWARSIRGEGPESPSPLLTATLTATAVHHRPMGWNLCTSIPRGMYGKPSQEIL